MVLQAYARKWDVKVKQKGRGCGWVGHYLPGAPFPALKKKKGNKTSHEIKGQTGPKGSGEEELTWQKREARLQRHH